MLVHELESILIQYQDSSETERKTMRNLLDQSGGGTKHFILQYCKSKPDPNLYAAVVAIRQDYKLYSKFIDHFADAYISKYPELDELKNENQENIEDYQQQKVDRLKKDQEKYRKERGIPSPRESIKFNVVAFFVVIVVVVILVYIFG